MTTTTASTRRSFIRTAGTALSVPLAVVAANAPALASAVDDGDAVKGRLAMLEDMSAIRALNQAYARHVNAGAREEVAALFSDPSDAWIDAGIRGVAADRFGEQDVIEIAADGRMATALLYCTVHAENAIGPSCPLVDMAREQGGGVVRRTESGVFENVYVKREGIWKIQRSTYRPV
jgi:hypothetical protein